MKEFWIWMVTFSAIALTVSAATQHLQLRPKPNKSHQSTVAQQQHNPTVKRQPFGNQRIIKIHGTPQVNNFNGHHKHVRNRPVVRFSKGHKKEELVFGQTHLGGQQQKPQQQQQTSFFTGGGIGYIKHLSLPPPHVYHKLPSYGSGFPYKISHTFRTSLSKPPFRKPSLVHVHPTTVKTVQSSHVTQMTPISAVSTKTTSASASYHSPSYTSFSFGSGPVHQIISSDGNNGPIREVPAPDLSLKSPEGALSFAKGHLTSQVATGLFTGFKDSAGSLETIVTTPGYDSILKTQEILVSPLVKNSALDVSHFVKDSFNGFSGDSPFGKLPSLDTSSFSQDSSVDVSTPFKGSSESDKTSSNYEVTEHHQITSSNDHVIKSHDGSKLYYAPDPDPSLPVYKVPPTKDPHSTPSQEQSLEDIYIPKISNGYSYIQGSGLGSTLAALTSEELYQLMQGYPTVLSHVPQPVVAYVGQPQSNSLTADLGQHYFRPSSTSSSSSSSTSSSSFNSADSSDIGDITQYLQNPEIHNLLHSPQKYNYPQDSNYSPTTNYASQLHQAVYSPQNMQYQDYFKLSQYKPFSYVAKSAQSTGPQTFDTSEGNHDYEPEASESRHAATVIRQTKEGTVGASNDKDSLPEDSDSNDLSFSASEDSDTPEDEPQVYHFKNIPEVPFYSSLPSEEAAKTLASLQAAGSVASDFLNNVKEMSTYQEPEGDGDGDADVKDVEGGLVIEKVTAGENSKNMGFYQFSGFKKLDDESKTDIGEEEEVKESAVSAEQEEQVVTDESKGTYSAVRQIVSTYRRNKDSSSKSQPENSSKQDSDELESKELVDSGLKGASSDQIFGKRIRPK